MLLILKRRIFQKLEVHEKYLTNSESSDLAKLSSITLFTAGMMCFNWSKRKQYIIRKLSVPGAK